MRASKGTLKESVYASLKAMIVSGELQAGSRLTEIDLAARLKVSRTPLREALNRLERDGLVSSKPRHGYFVTVFDLRTVEDAFDVREVLEGYAAERAAERIKPEDKERLHAVLRQCESMAARDNRSMTDMIQEMRLGLEIHRIIAEVSDNRLLHENICGFLDKFQHFIWIELLWLDEWAAARNEHDGIVAAICAGEGQQAAALARQHVRVSKENILRFLRAKTAYESVLARVS
jgi:DNA-binding GntR family transcriptional regulator